MKTMTSAFSSSRRNFLRGDIGRLRQPAIRPPWAVDETLFYDACTRCDACIESCPEKILRSDQTGYPLVDFSYGGCTFCSKCVDACDSKALMKTDAATPWSIHAVIGDGCLTKKHVVCHTCGERCEVGAIRFRPQSGGISHPQLDDALCTGCGFCVMDCPTNAIRINLLEAA